MGHLHSVAGAPRVTRRGWWAAVCSLAFVIVYAGTNWLAAQRSDVWQWYFAWELNIPFVPWMIIPYWSIDLFFIGAFFLCRTERELNIHCRRVLLAIAIAGLFFVRLPLRIAFPRPEVPGMLGLLFTGLRTFDQPHNLFPSLHIAFWFFLRDLYARHTFGWRRGLLNGWFILIGLSVLFTWQHHVIDIVGGAALATVCFYAIRETPWWLPAIANYRLAAYYLAGAATCGFLIPGIGWWPAVSLSLVALGYCGLGPGIYRKADGRIPLSAGIILAPVLLGQHLSLRYYRRQCRAWDEAAPGVLIGRMLTDPEADAVKVTAVLDLTAEFSECPAFLTKPYLNIPVLDLTELTRDQLQAAADFIQTYAANGRVYVHCKIGYSRSAAAVAAYLLAIGKAATVADALAQLRVARPQIIIRPEVERALQPVDLFRGSPYVKSGGR